MKPKRLVLTGATVVVVMGAGFHLRAQQSGALTPTFNKDIAPIIFNNCVSCHRPSQIAPMSFTSYKDVRPWARAIKTKVTKGEMPPWYADPRYGEFANDRRLTAEQIHTIAAWSDAGALEGDTPLTAQLPTFAEGWSHPSGRPPDFVIEMAETFNISAAGELPNFNLYQELPAELRKEDHFLEALQILPGNIPAVHHSSFGVRPLPAGTKVGVGEAWPGGPVVNGVLLDAKTGKPLDTRGDVNEAGADATARRSAAEAATNLRGANFCCYLPGGSFIRFVPGAGKRLPHDGYIIWGLHYTPRGKPVTDRERVGLWFQKGEMTHEIEETIGGETIIILGKELIDSDTNPFVPGVAGQQRYPARPVIPPFANNWSITALRAFKDDVTVYTIWPHMHQRGKEMTFVLTHADGREEVLLSVPHYDFNWQIFYELKEPKKIEAGSVLKYVGSYDNSANNKYNPAPQREVYWSEQSWDEMYNGFADISTDKLDLRLK